MSKLMSFIIFLALCFAVVAPLNTTWKTLDGNAPLVIAHGGFSGIFPDSSGMAYDYASKYSLPNMISWCNLQLTKDGVGVCLPELNLANNTNVDTLFPRKKTTYIVNNASVTGWFSFDFIYEEELLALTLKQGVGSRTHAFDCKYRTHTVEQVSDDNKRELWLNIQYDDFYKQRNLRITDYVKEIINRVHVKYVSSPEVAFLLSLESTNRTRVFQFPEDRHQTEFTSNLTYNYFLNYMFDIREFAEAILVPKSYILPVDSDNYLVPYTSLLPYTTLVSNAHKVGLQVFVYITNDELAYDFNFDPVAENLAFIGNEIFCVDGVISDFPLTPSAAIDCFSGVQKDDPPQKNILVISNEGASGVYPGCTDLAYQAALDDDVDVIDCPVQMTKDGLPICVGSINLMKRTNVAQSRYRHLARNVPELGGIGIYTFDLNWDRYQDFQPEIFDCCQSNPNPRFKNAGKLTALSVLLDTIKRHNRISSKKVGLSLTLENTDFLSKRGLDVIGVSFDLLRNTHTIESGVRIMIRSSEKSTLMKFKEMGDFELVYELEDIKLVNTSFIYEMRNLAHSVVISKDVAYTELNRFLSADKPIMRQVKEEFGKVYLKGFRNEFQPLDFLSDPYVELNTFVENGADGIITGFPQTTVNYRDRNRCLGMSKRPSYMTAIKPGELFKYIRHDFVHV